MAKVMHEFKPGDKVKWSLGLRAGTIFALQANDEGRWTMVGECGGVFGNVRPSELTPADPGPDWATLKVRELVAAEAASGESFTVAKEYKTGDYDHLYPLRAFAKYIRANPPRDDLTVEMVREACRKPWPFYTITDLEAQQIITTLTKPAK